MLRLLISKDPIDDTENTDHEHFLARIRSLPKPTVRRPLSLRDLQQRENATSPRRSTEIGDSQGVAPAFITSFKAYSLTCFR